MFRKILIANRGEIACRVIRTARRLGVATVAVHSDADAGAMHAAMADEAAPIGGAPPSESYLRGDRIIAVALERGAEAIHPGYGFLSENPDFAAAVEAAGLAYVGPSADAIRAMGMKDSAKRIMEEAGVPVVPGYHGGERDPDRLLAEAEAIGFPALIKAVAGGGGRGMRRVDSPEEFMAALESARSEALGAFGDDAVLVEKFLERPRHIEVQVFGDGVRAVHLHERDCSLQRRHQKVIEEAPAPGMTAETRSAMGAAAVRAAEAVGYKGAGTVEFIADASDGLRPDGFYFMEMNARLQVEHPVTEAIACVDLVEWQLRVAAGEPLPLTQEAIPLMGHAVEARLYAEDASGGFLPATGRLTHLAFPENLRVDAGARKGDEIGPHYDPLIAKLIAHGQDRMTALGLLERGLAEMEVAGVRTNLAFLGALVRDETFRAGQADTGLIERNIDELASAPPPTAETLAAAALAASGGDQLEGAASGFHLWAPLVRTERLVAADGTEISATLRFESRDRCRIAVGGRDVLAERFSDGWRFDGTRARAMLFGGEVAAFGRAPLDLAIVDPLDRALGEGYGADAIEAPMPGTVRAVHVRPGDRVAKGDALAVLEAMKMEHVLVAPRDGVVAEVAAVQGAQVEAGAELALLEKEESR